MSDPTAFTAQVLRHVLAQAEASTTDELAQRERAAASDIAAATSDPRPLLSLLAAHASACHRRLSTVAELREQARHDPLTGLRHHRPLAERLAAHAMTGVAVLIVDIDGFKTVNDTQGHPAGDAVLIALASALQQTLPSADELYRIGGDEFAALADVPDAASARTLAEKLREAAREINLTISVGVAIAASTEPLNATLHRADTALYAAKRAGGDMVCVADPYVNGAGRTSRYLERVPPTV